MLFQTHELSEHSTLLGLVLSPIQKQVLQNRIAELAASILSAEATCTDPKYFEKLNFTKGQMAELTSMITGSDLAESELNTAKE